ncbi:3-hydroxyacyl-CoA dehydrogenase family protein [Anaerovorax odorimutans]|uniref:3-hydroxyacyl-CoA dehydrogenase family protein n=1 Tax=Anaerovorax odorimutans TaxID=109327 RepID=A0ABT1RNZ9_9FIRM|nr:3-hydroxyacyl-CoA dehydrogenase family protein [Anaerovorax odorimutans]MCQ4636900.1 3-hydroxyacyl-CoA dehydrogenase family protein [Anaerovorax odorimutans]
MLNLPQNVTIVGSGTQGSMLAFRSAAFGRKVCLYDLSADQLTGAMEKIKGWFGDWVDQGKLSPDTAAAAYQSMRTATDLADALKDCDIIIENVPEILTLKQSVWKELDQAAPPHTLLTTNSSSLKASDIGAFIDRKDKTFNINFMTPTTDDLVEVMWNQYTSEETKEAALDFLTAQDNVPIITQKEIKGFSLNRVWRAIKKESLKLWAEGYITPEDFDRAWILEWGTPHGPFGLMDKVGLDIVEQIELTYYDESQDPNDRPPQALREMIEKGWLGEKTGRGFYEYPDPAYSRPGWLKGRK